MQGIVTCRYIAAFMLLFQFFAIAQENHAVKDVRFNGNTTFTASELSEQITTHSANKFQRFILRKKPSFYSRDIIEGDVESLIRFYQREGFLDAQIQRPELEINKKKRAVELTFNISEGEPFIVSDVRFQLLRGNENTQVDSIIEKNRPLLLMTVNKRFRDKAVYADRELIVKKFSEAGFPYVRVTPELNVDETANLVDLIWRIDSGDKCIFGDAEIFGNQNIAADMIRNKLAFKKGQVYHPQLINETQQNVYDLGIFQFVTVKALLNTQNAATIPVRIQIKEAPKFSTKFGLGYGKEDKFRFFSDARLLGFLGGARKLDLFFKHSRLKPYDVSLRFTQTPFFDPKTSLVLSPFVIKQDEPGFEVSRVGISTSVLHQINRQLNGSVTHTLEQVDAKGNINAQNASRFSQLYNKSSISLGTTFDNSFPIFSPVSGFFSALTFKVTGLGFNSKYHYTKLLLDVRNYRKKFGMVLASRLKIGSIDPVDGKNFIPIEDRFYSGGSNSVRGWSLAELGPLDAGGSPIGGNSLLEGSAEIRFPIMGIVSGVTFGDFGNVWLMPYDYRLSELRYAAGAGLRVATPIGPFRLDVARPVFDTEKTFQFHISVGHSF